MLIEMLRVQASACRVRHSSNLKVGLSTTRLHHHALLASLARTQKISAAGRAFSVQAIKLFDRIARRQSFDKGPAGSLAPLAAPLKTTFLQRANLSRNFNQDLSVKLPFIKTAA